MGPAPQWRPRHSDAAQRLAGVACSGGEEEDVAKRKMQHTDCRSFESAQAAAGNGMNAWRMKPLATRMNACGLASLTICARWRFSLIMLCFRRGGPRWFFEGQSMKKIKTLLLVLFSIALHLEARQSSFISHMHTSMYSELLKLVAGMLRTIARPQRRAAMSASVRFDANRHDK